MFFEFDYSLCCFIGFKKSVDFLLPIVVTTGSCLFLIFSRQRLNFRLYSRTSGGTVLIETGS